MKRTLTCVAFLFLVTWLGRSAMGYPVPATRPSPREVVFQHGVPQRIVLTPPGGQQPQAFWYMTYRVTNPTREELDFAPVFELVAADGQVVRSDRMVPPAVFDAIRTREKNKFLEPLEKIVGRLLPGEDQSKDGVAIWPEPEGQMANFTLFVAGLTPEAQRFRVDNGTLIPLDETTQIDPTKEKLLVLHKVLQLSYQAPGDAGVAKVEKTAEDWVMR